MNNRPNSMAELTASVKDRLDNSKVPVTAFAAVGDVMDELSINELVEFFTGCVVGGEIVLRSYMTEQLSAAVINKLKYEE